MQDLAARLGAIRNLGLEGPEATNAVEALGVIVDEVAARLAAPTAQADRAGASGDTPSSSE